MELKLRLQRVLQILGDAECAGTLSDLERDIILAELREAYSEVKFGAAQAEKEVIAPVVPQPESQPEPQPESAEEQENEPEVEFEIIYNEEDDEDEEGVVEVAAPEPVVESNEVEPTTEPVVEPAVEAKVEEKIEAKVEVSVEEAKPIVVEEPAVEEMSILPKQPTKRSPILSLYEDTVPVVGEQFREQPSVADAISCPKGVAESAPVTSLREAIGVADKFMLIRELFDGDGDAYEVAIDKLEMQPSFDDCVIYIAENYAWRAQSEGTKFMMELLQRKYNA